MSEIFTGFSRFSGEIAALSAAFLWAVSSIVFNKLGKNIRPLELNLVKGVGAIVLLVLTSLLMGESISALTPLAALLLLLSGAIGVGFGDTMYFEAINSIGPRRALLVTIMAPPLTAIMATLFLGEKIVPVAWIGILVTVLGVAWVITEKTGQEEDFGKILQKGVSFAFLAAFSQAAGAVMSRWALTQTSITALQSAILRLFAGIVFLLIWAAIRRVKLGQWIKSSAPNRGLYALILLAVIIGAYLPLWLQQISFKFTAVGIAQTLLSTSPLFVIPITAIQKEKVSLRAVLGVVIALSGVALLFLAG